MSLTMPRPVTLADSESFRTWSHARPLFESLGHAEADVRAKPQAPQSRWLLFELLCLLGHWERALKQLQAWAVLSKDFDATAHVMRGLIRAERQRDAVFAGTAQPAMVVAAADTPAPACVTGMTEALRLAAAAGEKAIEGADLAREVALALASDRAGSSNLLRRFTWITDSDSRLGPVCEVILVGAYRWVAFADLASVTKAAPRSLLDLVWAQVDIELRDRSALKGYMPMRYPTQANDSDALRMARETIWSEHGRTGVHARGQKMWMTDAGDMPLLDLRHCEFEGARDDAT
jgi:type VI secretion system protein ImpE